MALSRTALRRVLRRQPRICRPSRHCSCSATVQESVQTQTNASKASKGALSPRTTSKPPTPSADHRELAVSQQLFTTSPYSPGSPLFLPNGAHVFNKLSAFLRAQYTLFGFREVITPTIYRKSLWETSGHWENYAEDMFEVRGRGASGQTEEAELGEDEEFGLKPMNCPGHCLLFRSERRSYRDLPIRYADFSALHRNEISGALSGLTRVRRFHQDDGHIFCRPSQITQEISDTLSFVSMVYKTFSLGPFKLVLSTRPRDHYIGTTEEWDRAESQLRTALDASGRQWEINVGDGAFYGPKIDIILKDSDGKEHQTATIQLDFQLPQRFQLSYAAPAPEMEKRGKATEDPDLLAQSGPVTPVIIHRAIFGSLERFMALLIEHYNGRWPFWLSPRQAIIATVGNSPEVYQHAQRIHSALLGIGERQPVDDQGVKHASASNVRSRIERQIPLTLTESLHRFTVDMDTSDRSVAKKIAEAKQKKYNFILVVGPKDVEPGVAKVEARQDMKAVLDELQAEHRRAETKADISDYVTKPVEELGAHSLDEPSSLEKLRSMFTLLTMRYR